MKTFFPVLDISVLRQIDLVRKLLSENPQLFQDVDCPYDDATKAWFQKQATVAATAAVPVEVELNSTEAEIEEVLKHLKSLKASLPSETADQLQWVRVATSLLEKLVLMKERAYTTRRQQDFENQTIGILEDYLTPEQRTKFRERLADVNIR